MNQIKMGIFISELRKEKGLTQKEIGDMLNKLITLFQNGKEV